MIYIFGWLLMFLSAFLLNAKGGRFLVYIVILYCFCIAFFRGNVGTDTLNYISIFTAAANSYEIPMGEVGFKYLIYILNAVFSDPDMAVKSVSFVFFIALGLFFYRANENEAFLFIAYILPVFAYGYSMNGLRVGLAVAFFLLAIQAFDRKGFTFQSAISLLMSLSFHMSSLFLPVIYFFYQVKWLKLRFLVRFLVFSFFILVFLTINSQYLLGKYDSYASGDSSSPSSLSGLSILVTLLVVVSSMLLGKLPKKEKYKIFYMSFFLLLFSFVLARYSYAGLRVLDLLKVIIPIIILMAYSNNNIKFDRFIKFGLFLSALLSVFSTYAGYLSTYNQGGSPFLPYSFVFN